MRDYIDYYPTYEETLVSSGKTIFNEQLNGFDGKEVLIDNSVQTKALVTYHQNPINEFKENRRVTFWHEEFVHRGSIIKTIDDDRTFIVLSEINENDMVKYALMRETNKDIKWIDSNNTLVTKPAIISAQTLYTTGVKEGKIIQIPDGMVGIQLPYDEDTKQLNRDAAFVFNKTKYKITFYNEVEFPGLLVLICDEAIPNPKYDDMENEIADRWDKEDKDRLEVDLPTNPDNITIIIAGEDRLDFISEKTYTATINDNGVAIDGEVTFKLSNNLATIKSQGDNQCVLKANTKYNSGEVVLTATLVSDEEILGVKNIIVSGF